MAIRKQEFYEGAALHLLAKNGGIKSLSYDAPFFLINEDFLVHLKYSTKGRSPWGFTFTPEEQLLLRSRSDAFRKSIIGLICGSDGIAAIAFDTYLAVAPMKGTSVHVSCYRKHREHYEVNGPEGTLVRKVAPSEWQRILEG